MSKTLSWIFFITLVAANIAFTFLPPHGTRFELLSLFNGALLGWLFSLLPAEA